MPLDTSRLQVEARIHGLAAYIASVRRGPDDGLNGLREVPDPEARKRKLQILLEAKRFGDAADLVRGAPPEAEWADRAVAALVANSERAKAEEVLQWASSHATRVVWQRCVLRYVERAYEAARCPPNGAIGADVITPEQKALLSDLLRVAEPLLGLIRTCGRIANGLEARVALIASHASGLIGSRRDAARIGAILSTQSPVPLEMAQLALEGFADVPADLAARLRTEHPKSFQAKLLACVIEARLLQRGADAFPVALRLADEAQTAMEQRQLCAVLLEIAQGLGSEQMREAERIAPSLLASGDRFLKTLQAMAALRQGNLMDAGTLLSETVDETDPYWLQAKANHLAATGDRDGAIDHLLKAAAIFSHPIVLGRLASLAFQQNRLGDAKMALERLLRLEPEDLGARHDLAMVYARLAEWPKAAEQFRALRQREATDLSHGVNEANALAQGGDLPAALGVYDELCAQPSVPAQIIVSRAQLLRQLDRAPDAFGSLVAVRDRFWESPEFLAAYLDLAYAADEDSQAHDAMVQLLKLQSDGRATPILESKSLDDITDHIRQYRERTEWASDHLLQGKLPWLMADGLLGNVSYWGWRIRTQEMAWLAEDCRFWAQRCIYSTNGFTAGPTDAGKLRLQDLLCASKGQSIVIDMSALITLDHLGLLEQTGAYFGRILYPASYHTLRLQEADRLVLHQPSRRRALREVKAAIDDRRIAVVAEGSGTGQIPGLCVNEYASDSGPQRYYRLTDLLPVLGESGASDAVLDSIRAVAQKPSGVDDAHPTLRSGSRILIDAATLSKRQ